MKTLLLFILLIPTLAHAGNWDLGVGHSDRQDDSVAWDYTLSTVPGFSIQYNIGALYGYGITQPEKQVTECGAASPIYQRVCFPHTVTVNGNPDHYSRALGYAGMSMIYQSSHYFVSLGAIELTHETPYLTSKYQFLSNAGLIFGSFRVGLRHISNGNTGGPNGGETLIYISASY